MIKEYFDRYSFFKINNTNKPVFGVFLDEKPSDKTIIYKLGLTRLDRVSQRYYNSPYYNWLILLANPQFGGLEFNIPDGTILRIPFPLNSALLEYTKKVEQNIIINGI
jgi:hypothetical protein